MTRFAAVLAFLVGGWMAFDGAHAWVTGDYVTPRSGSHAGQLGPWSLPLRGIGVEPRSALVKTVFLLQGAFGLAAGAAILRGSRAAAVAFGIASLWYLPFGTACGLVLVLWGGRRSRTHRSNP